ncbi:MAG: serine hydrolase [Pseudomonadota bacterium]
MQPVHDFIQRAVDEEHFTHACLIVAQNGQPLIHESYGKAGLDSVFDLASLTKPLATTAVLMQLVAQNKLALKMRLFQAIPSLVGRPVGPLNFAQLLTHSAGLAAWYPFFEQVRDIPFSKRKAAVRRMLAGQTLEYKPDSTTLYSDLGFMLLGWAIEKSIGHRLDILAKKLIFRPLGLNSTFFVPLTKAGMRPKDFEKWPFVPTEKCPWRGRRLLGEVHDDNCHVMGGVAGHAGLFSIAHDVHLLTRELFAAYLGERSIFSPKVVRTFWDWRIPHSARALGWDRASDQERGNKVGFGPNTVGHLGFTGTSLWVDLDRAFWVIFLTNRVYKGREPNPMPQVRKGLHDLILRHVS